MITLTELDETPITTPSEISSLMADHPNLCYAGWKTPWLAGAEFLQRREELRAALTALDLCRRVFRDPRFRLQYHGQYTGYRLKHVVEFWELNPIPCDPPPAMRHYNGIYVCQGVAAAAAILEGFDVWQFKPRGADSLIRVPLLSPPTQPWGSANGPQKTAAKSKPSVDVPRVE